MQMTPLGKTYGCYALPVLLILITSTLIAEILAECTEPRISDHVIYQPKMSIYPSGTNVLFECQEGFLLEGASSAQCRDNGQWSKIAPICLPLCQAPPVLENGSFTLPSGRIVPGSQYFPRCNTGFVLSGHRSRRCQENGFWGGPEPKCVPTIGCSRPSLTSNVIVLDTLLKTHFTPGSKISLGCKDGFKLVGEAVLTCDETGNWSHKPPVCTNNIEKTCPQPGTLANGEIQVINKGTDESKLQAGAQIEFSCEVHHFLVGATSAQCQDNGEWSALLPICFPVRACPSPGELLNGIMTIPTPRKATTEMIDLRSDANISKRIGIDMNPRVPAKEVLKVTLREGFYHIGTQVTFQCESKFYRLAGSRVRTCLADGKWSGRSSTCIPVCGHSSSPRSPFVTHGIPSEVGQWPWMVGVSRRSMNDQFDLHCGASLVDVRWVVTAAHCVTFTEQTSVIPADELRLYMGKYYRNNSLDDGEVQFRNADVIHVHPDYQPHILDSDIALIRLDHPVRLSSRVQPVCLPSPDYIDSLERLKDGSLGVVIGWGATEKEKMSPHLVHAQLPVASRDECMAGYRKVNKTITVTTNMICAGHPEGKHDACNGDSGGPFVFPVDDRSGTYILEGITSWGSPAGCGLANQYGGFVRVQRFLDWISNFL